MVGFGFYIYTFVCLPLGKGVSELVICSLKPCKRLVMAWELLFPFRFPFLACFFLSESIRAMSLLAMIEPRYQGISDANA